ncbi:MAG: putative lipopolysaccharide heptosyltransferase III [Deltaproteobacteria bacterium]|nr:putative lipopolysaccharide heptosyltransferase III [Deltaproteobacteria bacterium]
MSFKNIKKILVIKLRQIGDVLLTVPAFRALRENFPEAHIAALVNSGTEEVLGGSPLIDEVITYNRGINKLNPWQRSRREIAFVRELRKQRFDLAIDLSGGDRAAITAFLSGARYRIGTNVSRYGFWGKSRLYTHFANGGGKHIVLRDHDVMAQFGIHASNLSVDFFIPPAARRQVEQWFRLRNNEKDLVVHIHPVSKWFFKCWKDEDMAEVAGWLINQGVKVVVTSSPESLELQRTRNMLSLIPGTAAAHSHLLDLSGQTTLPLLAAVSEAADLFLGIDSAPMHISAAVGTPVIALFGPSLTHRWAPWPNQRLFESKIDLRHYYRDGCYYLGDHVVIQKDWECVPCGRDGCEGTKQSRCLDEISVEKVKEILMTRMKKKIEDEINQPSP